MDWIDKTPNGITTTKEERKVSRRNKKLDYINNQLVEIGKFENKTFEEIRILFIERINNILEKNYQDLVELSDEILDELVNDVSQVIKGFCNITD